MVSETGIVESDGEVKDSMNTARVRRGRWTDTATRLRGLLLYGLVAVILLGVSPATAKPGAEITLVAFGDSLTAGLGVAPDKAFPAQLEKALKARGYRVRVVNAGVSGDTTAAGLARLDWAIPQDADAVIVQLGANDALRGLLPARARANLDAILSRLKQKGVAVLLAGMLAPRNLGPDYVRAFDAIYAALAEKHGVPRYPFFLEGVAGDSALNQPDGLHPNAEGVAVIVENIRPAVEALLDSVRKAAPAGATQ